MKLVETRWHVLALALVAFAIGLLFLQEPGFGDDLTYWSFAFDLHERGLVAWQKASFHDLRWPVWGVCWAIQAVLGPGLASYYGEPLLYLVGGALLAFAFGKKLTGSNALGWACGIAFPFHPLLDTVCYRPMPDLSEGVWGAAIMLAWWCAMTAETRRRTVLASAAVGASIFIIEANRITGVFIVPVLILSTLIFFPRRFGWLVLAGAVAALLYAGECFFYHRLFGDWFHDLTANTGNKGAKGTEFPNPWAMPFRFFDTLWKGNPLAPVYCILGALGIWAAWKKHGVLGRVVVVWFGALFLLYSCAPQSLSPYRPLVRDADRFLAALAVPLSVLAALGLWTVADWIAATRFGSRAKAMGQHPFAAPVVGVASIALLALVTSRSWFEAGFVPEMRRYLQAVPTGTKVFSHKAMREIVHLVDATSARRFVWSAPNEIIHRTDKLEAQAAECGEFWYARKLVWLTTRKALEKKSLTRQPPLGSYLDTPEREWTLTGLFAKGDTPDLTFYRRRLPDSPPTQILGPTAAEWQSLIPALPTTLTREHGTAEAQWKIPAALKGRLARFEFEAAAEQVEALTVRVRFAEKAGDEPITEYLLKPYLYRDGGKEFFAFQLPADADYGHLQLKLAKSAKQVTFTSFRALVEPAH